MQVKIHVKKGDMVKVISGNSKGETGRILSVDRQKGRALVEGVNMVSVHTKPNAQNQEGGIIKKEAPLNTSKLMLVDSKGVASRVGKRIEKDGSKVRYSKKSGEVIK